MNRSTYWEEVSALAERSRRASSNFDPAEGDWTDCIETGVAPIVRLYVETCREGVELTDVERSLLEGVLNDWLRQYAACRDLPAYDGATFSLHEVAMEAAEAGDVGIGVERLLRENQSLETHPDATD